MSFEEEKDVYAEQYFKFCLKILGPMMKYLKVLMRNGLKNMLQKNLTKNEKVCRI